MPGVDDQARISAFGGRWPGKEALVRRTPTLAEREHFRDQLQTQYEARVAALGRSVADGSISVRQWQGQMDRATTQYLIRQQALGSGTTRLDSAAFLRLDAEVRRQQAFISRFADHIGAGTVTGKPLSAGQISSRATTYSGAGRAVGARAQEQSADAGELWRYLALDDGRTCGPCLAAEGTYPAGQGPFPGSVCLGRGHCRCKRELVDQPNRVRRIA
jgi:hypothetical protein